MTVLSALNLTPIFEILLYVAVAAAGLFVLYLIGFFILNALGSAGSYLSGDKSNEFGEIIVFWGGVAIVIGLIVLAFTQGIVAFE